MQFFTLIISALAATALAAPTEPQHTTTPATYPPTNTKSPYPGGSEPGHGGSQPGHGGSQPGGGSYMPCDGFTIGNAPKCCSADVLGLLGVNCVDPSATPTSASDFSKICSKKGMEASCCPIKLLGQGLLCSKPKA